MQIGDTVNLIRKITGEKLPVELTEVLHKNATPAVVVRWKSDRHRYKVDLVKGEILAIDCTPAHRQSMRAWYTVNEEDKKALTELYQSRRRRGK